MRLSSISVSRFRSIRDATRVELDELTVLIGRNNEGKSNFLRAIEVGMNAIREHANPIRVATRSLQPKRIGYDWQRDFPIDFQNNERRRQDTTFRLSFNLNDEEQNEFSKNFNIKLSTDITLEISIDKDSSYKIRWAKQGHSGEKIDSRISDVCQFIVARFIFLYVPAIRTDRDSRRIVESLIQTALQRASNNQEYMDALNRLRAIESPILDHIGNTILPTLRNFLPDITSVKLEQGTINLDYINRSRDIRILLDDGNETDLSMKGEGIKSIIALALFQHSMPVGYASMVAIEEPEAHLHAGAIQKLRDVLVELSKQAQVLISTHSANFVWRVDPSRNLIVQDGNVRKAKNVSEIRDMLGIQKNDNLTHSEFVIVVEGLTDVDTIRKALSKRSKKLESLFSNHSIVVEPARGSSKLSYRASTLKRELVPFFVIFDGDKAGREQIQAALGSGAIDKSEYALLIRSASSESELEDFVRTDLYLNEIEAEFNISIGNALKDKSKKWSDKMGKAFSDNGKIFDQETKEHIKHFISKKISQTDEDPIDLAYSGIFDNISSSIETSVSKLHI